MTTFEATLDSSIFQPVVRYRAVGTLDLLAACGGLLGLVAGISVFSIIEIVLTAFHCIKTVFCKSKVHPAQSPQARRQKQFLIDRNSLFYKAGKSFQEFLSESGIHGLHYTNDKESTASEKVFWTLALLVSTVVCSIVTANAVQNLQSNVVEIRMDEKIWSAEDVS